MIPYFTDSELPNRQNEFERNNNVNQFVFETPFTRCEEKETEDETTLETVGSSLKSLCNSFESLNSIDSSKKAHSGDLKGHGRLKYQWKRRVILTTEDFFPYVEKRSIVTNRLFVHLTRLSV